MNNECIFCKISKKEIPAKIKFEDDTTIAFNDINPKAPIHILIAPKKHIESISMMDNGDLEVVQKLIIAAKKVAKSKRISDFRLVFNSGPATGMEIDHLHLHLLGGKKLGPIC